MLDSEPDTRFSSLLGAARAGDARALENLLADYLPALRAFVRLRANRVIRARESESDVVQSVCREVIQRLGSFRRKTEHEFRNWIFMTAEQKLVDRLRFWRAARRDPAAEIEDFAAESADPSLLESYATFCAPSQDAIAREELERIEQAFESLPDECREAILLVRVAGLSHAEAAKRAGRETESLRHYLYRGLALLAEELGE